MEQIAISKFKATCLAVLEDVRKTGKPIRVTRFGKPVAEIVPPKPEPKDRSHMFGCLSDVTTIEGDIVGPVGVFENWNPYVE